MKFFDLHCDTVQKIVEEGHDFNLSKGLHMSLPGIISADLSAQVFACFVHGSARYENPYEACNSYIDAIENLIKTYPDRLIPASSPKNLSLAFASKGKTAVIISIEGATPLMGKVETLGHFYNRGVRLLTIAWDDNEFCGTVFGDNSGLTKAGEHLIRFCNDLGIAVDVSHASDKAFYDIAGITKKAFLASHSNARQICPNDRNLTDDMIRIIARRGGVIGLVFGSGFISPEYYIKEKNNRDMVVKGLKNKTITFQDAKKISQKNLSGLRNASLFLLMDHVKHMIRVGGEDCLSLGSDFDGVDSLPEGITGVESLPLLVQQMEKMGITPRVMDKICHQNAFRFFSEVCGM